MMDCAIRMQLPSHGLVQESETFYRQRAIWIGLPQQGDQ